MVQQQPLGSKAKKTQEFLSRVLSRRSLPYEEDMKLIISQHLISLTEANPSVIVVTGEFISDKSKPPILLHARLNIPMVYQSVTYYLPVAFWLTELYPRYAPHVCVYPTADMFRKRNHPFVNPHGFVTIDYLQNWVYPTCNLVDLCPKLSEAFALDPPLYSKSRPDPNPHFNTSPSIKSNLEPKPSSSSVLVPHGEGGRILPDLSSVSAVVTAAVTGAAKISRSDLIRQLLESVYAEVDECRKKWEVKLSETLAWNGLQMRDGEGLEQQLHRVLKIANVLRSLVSNNECKLGGAAGVSGDEHVLSKQILDVLFKQMLECTASDLAIEDVTDGLDGVLENDKIPLDVHMHVVRSLARLQFKHRYTSVKVHAILTTMRDRHFVL